MIKLTIDGKTVEVDDGTTLLDAARKVGVDIPTLCFFETRPLNTRPLDTRPLNPPQGDLKNGELKIDHLHFQSPPAGDLGGAVLTETSPPGPLSHRRGGAGDEGAFRGTEFTKRQIEPPVSCFVCAVKLSGRNGFVPSCVALAEEGMVVECSTDEVFKIRRQALELLLSHHNGDCEAPCTRICPCSIDIPEMIRAIITGNSAGMISAARAAMPFPAVLAHICLAPCEKGCRRKQVDSAVSIRELHKFAAVTAMNSPEYSAPTILPSTGKNVAIVGAGLAGLTAAYHLSCLGHACIVIEKNSRPAVGTYCTEHQLPAAIFEYEIDQIRKCGVTFQFDKEVTSLQELTANFDAIVIACGSQSTQWIEQQGISCTERGIDVHKGTFATSVDGVFAIGGAIILGKSSSRTVGQSTKAAFAIHRFLMVKNSAPAGTRPLNPTSAGLPQGDFENRNSQISISNPKIGTDKVGTGHELSLPVFNSYMSKMSTDDLQRFAESIPAKTSESLEPNDRDRSRPVSIVSEMAAQCLQCDCGKKSACDLRRYAAEYGAQQPVTGHDLSLWDKPLKSERRIFPNGLVYEPGKCILCGRCVGITKSRPLNTRPLSKTRPQNPPQGDFENVNDQVLPLHSSSPPAGDFGGAFPGDKALECSGLTFLNRGSDLFVDTPFGEPMDTAMGECMDQCIDACPTGALWKVK